jgi:serine/threonine-protein kinase HipA
LARALGLPAAHSEVRSFEGVPAIVIERYDRVREGNQIRRAHQEDFCQALRVHPALKYQNEGGPGAKQIVDALRDHVRDLVARETDISGFVDALIFNWLIGGTDAHAKNYSVLIGAGGAVRFAPLYDIASILAYPDIDPQKAKLVMKIGGEYRLRDIGYSEWRKQALELRMDSDELVIRARNMAAELPDYLSTEVNALQQSGLGHPIISTMTKTLTERALRITRTGQAG